MIGIQIEESLRQEVCKLNNSENVSVYMIYDDFRIDVDVHFLMPTGDGGTYWECETSSETLTRDEALERINNGNQY